MTMLERTMPLRVQHNADVIAYIANATHSVVFRACAVTPYPPKRAYFANLYFFFVTNSGSAGYKI